MVKALYIHIPFCRKKCIYCDFYSVAYNKSLATDYVTALIKQIEGCHDRFTTVYIGGGTPSILDLSLMDRLLSSLKGRLGVDCEFTIEANPDSLTEEKVKLFLDNGVNRVSIGVQSFHDKKLEKLGRVHSAAQAKDVVESVYRAGCKNISCDLIFGVWGETLKQWQEDIIAVTALPVSHISAYALSCEDGTPLCKDVDLNRIELMDDGRQSEFYSFTMQALPLTGFGHYEISNYARPGFECRHNMAYWRNESYLGLGVTAAGYIDRVRYKNTANIKEYIKLANKKQDCSIYKEVLSEEERARETAAIKIRTAEGIDLVWFKAATGFDFMFLYGNIVDGLVKQKLVEVNCSIVKLTSKGFLFADDVSSRLI